jgi:hypothetical protein
MTLGSPLSVDGRYLRRGRERELLLYVHLRYQMADSQSVFTKE